MRCILVSYFNSNNVGDLLLSLELYNNLSENNKILCCSFEGNFVVPIDRKYSNKFIVRIINKFINKKLFWKIFEKTLKRYDALVIGGGNMLMDIKTYSTLEQFERYVSIAQSLNKKIIIPFVGIGPIDDVNKFNVLKETLKKCNYISVRDRYSYNYISDLNARCVYDPAFLIKKKNSKKDKILINVISPMTFDKSLYNKYLNFYIKLINIIKDIRDYKIEMIVTETADYEFANEIKKSIIDFDIYINNVRNSNELIETVSKCAYAIGSRMHFLITVYTQDIPFVGLKWQNKILGFFDNINLNSNCFDFDEENIDSIFMYFNTGKYKQMYTDKINTRKKEIIQCLTDEYKYISTLLDNDID